jgi:hypothetical protein
MNSVSQYIPAFIIVSWLFGLAAIFDVLLQPGRAFRSSGHSKLRWLAVEVLGFLLSYTGLITWALYSIWIRPSVVRAGGRRRIKGALFIGFLRALGTSSRQSTSSGSTWSPPSTSSRSPAAQQSWAPGPRQKCSKCGGTKEETCFACQGRGYVTNPAYAPYAGTTQGSCSACTASGKRKCGSCNGTGYA